MTLHLTSPRLAQEGFRHAFFTRRGGVSAGEHASLNFAASTGDDPENVARNVERAAEVLGVDAARVLYLSQVHGADAVVVTGADARDGAIHREGDAIAARAGEPVACGVRSADCGTILVGDAASGAVAAIHAGWRGTVRGVVPAAVARLRELAGGGGRLVAAIGPHIEACCFEVGDEVAAELAAASDAGGSVVRPGPRGKPHVDLRAVLRAQLRAAGLDGGAIDDVRGCTACDPERFFSYRRQGPRSGRLLAAIVPRAAR
jgi:YfiH family protein